MGLGRGDPSVQCALLRAAAAQPALRAHQSALSKFVKRKEVVWFG